MIPLVVVALFIVVTDCAAGKTGNFFYTSEYGVPFSVEQDYKFRFSTIYGDHMVLQQAPHMAVVWGYIPNCQKVTVMFNGKTMDATIMQCMLIITSPLHMYCILSKEINIVALLYYR